MRCPAWTVTTANTTPEGIDNSTNSSYYIPARFRPPADIYETRVKQPISTVAPLIIIRTTGIIQVYNDAGANGFAISTTAGVYGFCMVWTVI